MITAIFIRSPPFSESEINNSASVHMALCDINLRVPECWQTKGLLEAVCNGNMYPQI